MPVFGECCVNVSPASLAGDGYMGSMDLYTQGEKLSCSCHMLVSRHCFCRLIFFAFRRGVSFSVIARRAHSGGQSRPTPDGTHRASVGPVGYEGPQKRPAADNEESGARNDTDGILL